MARIGAFLAHRDPGAHAQGGPVAFEAPTVTVSAKDDTLEVQVAGELDLATSPQLASHLGALIRDGGAISLDLARVTFIDMAGLRVLVEARHDAHARGQQLHIAVPGHACARLLELTRTTQLLRAI